MVCTVVKPATAQKQHGAMYLSDDQGEVACEVLIDALWGSHRLQLR